ncbi:MAG: peptidoglycan-associated lipoprotein [Halothiobacillaceae bacterium]|nr:MAG: peptidoglycan-associated lipoprotein [Halothiobacillaceae bacterium]
MRGWVKLSMLFLLAGVVLSGCSSVPKEGEAAVSGEGSAATSDSSGNNMGGSSDTSGVNGSGSASGSDLDNPNSPLSKRIIYFDYDSSVVRDEFTSVLEAHARHLADNPDVHVTLQGHGDERGSREYNLGLGDRRANAVAQFLKLTGAKPDQIQVESYGEERPADAGHDESAWQANRRVELVYE